jgi:membrane protein implicated in regulation of membrane protease activity
MDEYVAWLWDIEFWHWWALGLFLIAIEVFAPSTLLIWPAVSAGVVGVVLLIDPTFDWRYQILVFAVLSLITTVVWFRYWLRRHPTETDHPMLNVRGKSLVGRRIRLDSGSESGRGRIHVDDSSWSYATENGDDLPAGTAVEIVGHDGNLLTVRKDAAGTA